MCTQHHLKEYKRNDGLSVFTFLGYECDWHMIKTVYPVSSCQRLTRKLLSILTISVVSACLKEQIIENDHTCFFCHETYDIVLVTKLTAKNNQFSFCYCPKCQLIRERWYYLIDDNMCNSHGYVKYVFSLMQIYIMIIIPMGTFLNI